MATLKELYTTLKSLRDMNLPVDDKLEDQGTFLDPKATLRAEDRRRTPRELKWME